jgi:hypothetical protein
VPPLDAIGRVAEQLSDPRTWGEHGERVVETGQAYHDGEPVRILVRKRGWRYDLDDRGSAIAKARSIGAVDDDWREIAERVVVEGGFNVNRRGVVFVGAVEGRDIATLALRLGECAYAVYAALVESAIGAD